MLASLITVLRKASLQFFFSIHPTVHKLPNTFELITHVRRDPKSENPNEQLDSVAQPPYKPRTCCCFLQAEVPNIGTWAFKRSLVLLGQRTNVST